MLPKIHTRRPFKTQINWGEANDKTQLRVGHLVSYKSKTDAGARAGVHGDYPKLITHALLAVQTIVLQAEIYAIKVCMQRVYRGKDIIILR